ncbi:MAG: Hsp70 family protein [bacterium]|nr:Hsp70 family protein [bacterium]
MRRVEEAAEQAKKELSTAEITNINLPYITQVRGEALHLELSLSRAKFQELVYDLVDRTTGPVQSALQDAGIAPSELGRVLLVGGVATRLIERNTTLPTRYSRVFSTAAPYQRDVEIRVLQGERPMAKDNKKIGDFRLKGIRKAPAGVPQIEVTFDIDANGILKVSAKDLDTGKEQSITITADDRMSDAEIEQAMRDAAEYAGQDNLRREALELSSEANQIVIQAQKKLKEEGKQMDKAVKKQLKSANAALQKCLSRLRVDKVTQEDINKLKCAKEEVERLL